MATFVLIPGAGSTPWYWHLVEPLLREAGHDTVAVDLPVDDDSAGLREYTDVTVEAIGDRSEVVLVAQSMGGFTAPLVCARVPVEMMVLVAAMAPLPGEAPGDWWAATGHDAARRAQAERDDVSGDEADDPEYLFLHDVPRAEAEESIHHVVAQSGTPFAEPWPLDAWPDVTTHFLLCRHDRFFPATFQRRVVRERLGIVPDEMDGGHLPALAHPRDLAARILGYWDRADRQAR